VCLHQTRAAVSSPRCSWLFVKVTVQCSKEHVERSV
jgi:hypothetical protein